MSDFACERCGLDFGDVRLVEHGTDDIALCKQCFRSIENDTDQFGSVVPGFKVRGMEPERNVYDFLISVDLEFAEELRSLDVPEKQEGAAEHISGALTHDMAHVRFVGDSFLLRGITAGFQATGLDLYKEERGRQQFATHNVDTSDEAIEVMAAFSRWEDLASHLLEDRREDDGLRADGGIAVGSYEDLGADHSQPVDRNPSLACEICGESFNWQDYWKDRILSSDDPENAPLWCDDCEDEIQTIRRRLSNNSRITDWNSRAVDTGVDHDE